MPPSKPLKDRFLAKVNKTEDGCWLWTGGLSDSGYGRIGHKDKILGAHRVAWELFNGRIPPGAWVLHRCDNPACVNPKHLFLGDAAHNTRDMLDKDRQGWDSSKGPSGKVGLRMEPQLHAHLKALAKAQGISLNQYMIERLAGATGFKLDRKR